ncbi:MAG: Tfp pilus assembly protein PilV [Verrucomicrobiales bacterium]
MRIRTLQKWRRQGGYMLLEVLIALTVFSIAVVGMAEAINASIEAMNFLTQQERMRNRLQALLVEAKQKPKREEMVFSIDDLASGVNYRTELEELKWVNRKKEPITGLYVLRAIAEYNRNGKPQKEVVQVYVQR